MIGKSYFYGEDIYYNVDKAIIFPLLGSFRGLIRVDDETGDYYWTKNPLKTWDEIGYELVESVANNAKIDNLTQLAKDYSLWNSLLLMVYQYGL